MEREEIKEKRKGEREERRENTEEREMKEEIGEKRVERESDEKRESGVGKERMGFLLDNREMLLAWSLVFVFPSLLRRCRDVSFCNTVSSPQTPHKSRIIL